VPRVIVIVDRIGQLGNRLFHFGHFIAFAAAHDVHVANPAFDDFASDFPAFRGDLLCRFPTVRRSLVPVTKRTRALTFSAFDRLARARRRPVPIVRLNPGEVCDLSSPEFRRQAESRLLLVSGWQFRDAQSFQAHADLLRKLFTPLDRYRRRAEQVVSHARRGDVLVGVHIRHRDYETYAGGRHFHSVDAYARLMQRIERAGEGRDIRFLVCSDDPANPATLANERVTPGPGHLIEDICALAKCDYIVGPPSTYSAWASFYGQVPIHHFEDADEEISLDSFRVSGG
jgi:hypothetical protein